MPNAVQKVNSASEDGKKIKQDKTYLSLSRGITTLANFPNPVVTPYTTI